MDNVSKSILPNPESLAQTLWAAFPDVPFPADAPIGYGVWVRDENDDPSYYLNSDAIGVEAFFRGLEREVLWHFTLDVTGNRLCHFLQAAPPPRRWREVVGKPLLSWDIVTSSISFFSPQGRAYYLPAYLLTMLPILASMQVDNVIYETSMSVPDFVYRVIDALLPPKGLQVWERLLALPAKNLAPHNTMFASLSEEERFLCFVGQFTRRQCQAISQFVAYVLLTYPFYVHPADSDDADEIAALSECWLLQEDS